MFAILGLRALFFLIAAAIQRLRYLNIGLGLVLGFIGVKMLVPFVYAFLEARGLHPPHPPGFHVNPDTGHLHLPVRISLIVIVGVLALTALLSVLSTRGAEAEPDAAAAPEVAPPAEATPPAEPAPPAQEPAEPETPGGPA
ncbi:MAG: hypothetical protein R3F62_23285 [Planctomycetota bacterium]